MNEILSLHVVRDRLNVERIRQGNINLVNKNIFIIIIISIYINIFIFRYINFRLQPIEKIFILILFNIVMVIKR